MKNEKNTLLEAPEMTFESDILLRQEGNTILMYALSFESLSNIIVENGETFREIIDKGAIAEERIANDTVLAVINHDPYKGILAQSIKREGDLTLSVDDKGLLAAFPLPENEFGNQIKEKIQTGELSKASFYGKKIKYRKIGYDKNNVAIRRILHIEQIKDVSLVTRAAYDESQVIAIRNNTKKQDLIKQKLLI